MTDRIGRQEALQINAWDGSKAVQDALRKRTPWAQIEKAAANCNGSRLPRLPTSATGVIRTSVGVSFFPTMITLAPPRTRGGRRRTRADSRAAQGAQERACPALSRRAAAGIFATLLSGHAAAGPLGAGVQSRYRQVQDPAMSTDRRISGADSVGGTIGTQHVDLRRSPRPSSRRPAPLRECAQQRLGWTELQAAGASGVEHGLWPFGHYLADGRGDYRQALAGIRGR